MATTTTNLKRRSPTSNDLDKLYDSSALTMMGYIKDELELYIEALEPFIKGDSVTVYETTGKELAQNFDVSLPTDLNVFLVDLEELKDINKLAVTLRFQLGFRWLDDVINNLHEE